MNQAPTNKSNTRTIQIRPPQAENSVCKFE